MGQYENQVLGTLPPHLFAVGKFYSLRTLGSQKRKYKYLPLSPTGQSTEDAMSRLKASLNLNLECQDYDWTGAEFLI